jgi:hypothetical protein
MPNPLIRSRKSGLNAGGVCFLGIFLNFRYEKSIEGLDKQLNFQFW